jgi:hypothetical protein
MSNHVAALQFVNPSPPICWQRLVKEYFKKTKRRAKPVLLSQLLAIYGQEAKPVPQVMGKPPHGDSKCTIPRKNNSAGWI